MIRQEFFIRSGQPYLNKTTIYTMYPNCKSSSRAVWCSKWHTLRMLQDKSNPVRSNVDLHCQCIFSPPEQVDWVLKPSMEKPTFLWKPARNTFTESHPTIISSITAEGSYLLPFLSLCLTVCFIESYSVCLLNTDSNPNYLPSPDNMDLCAVSSVLFVHLHDLERIRKWPLSQQCHTSTA